MKGSLPVLERIAKFCEGRDVSVVTGDVTQQPNKARTDLLVEVPPLADRAFNMGLEVVEPPIGSSYAYDRNTESLFAHRIERREDLLVREIAACAKQDQCIRLRAGNRLKRSLTAMFPGVRQIRDAWQTRACGQSRPHLETRNAHKVQHSKCGRARQRRWLPLSSSVLRPNRQRDPESWLDRDLDRGWPRSNRATRRR